MAFFCFSALLINSQTTAFSSPAIIGLVTHSCFPNSFAHGGSFARLFCWGPFVVGHDRRYWYNDYSWGEIPFLCDLQAPPNLEKNIVQECPHVCQRMKRLVIADAGARFHIP